ncbi:MAG: hypothetical protein ACNI3A_12415 [Desulfovibrio sp.]|uniref:hypothetical protein n=1 Tax=Desulfovibrio sp. 7SRBS1 TaxID=3378064 RepID=UPI003B3C9818
MNTARAYNGLELLRLIPGNEEIIEPHLHTPTSLIRDIDRLCTPSTPITDGAVLNLVIKYFFAYVHPSSCPHVVRLEEITRLFQAFSQLNDKTPGGRPRSRTMQLMKQVEFGLRMLADVPKTARIVRSIIRRNLPPSESFLGFDIGTGSGILLLAMYIMARRNGFEKIENIGLEVEDTAARRTRSLAARLEFGLVIKANAKDPRTFLPYKDRKVNFVSNETIAGVTQRLGKEDFTEINQTLFNVFGKPLVSSAFFPERLYAFSPKDKISVQLEPLTRFQPLNAFSSAVLYPQGIRIEGQDVPLDRLGEDLNWAIPDSSRRYLTRRW